MFGPRTFNGLLGCAAVMLPMQTVSAQSDPASVERTIPKFEATPAAPQPETLVPVVLPPRTGARISNNFVLGAVNLDGATVFSSAELAGSFEAFLASHVGQSELDRIASAITDRYRDRGYLLSYAILPEQSVRSGIVRVRVVEGYIDHVRLEGRGRSAEAARAIAERLVAERPLRKSTLERALGLIKDIPGVTVSDVRISRSPVNPARHRLTIKLGSDRARQLTYMDNRGSVEGARVRGYSTLSLASAAVPGDQLQLDVFTIPSRKFRFLHGQAKASLPIGSDGLRVSAAVSRAEQLHRLDGDDQRGDSRQLIADLSFPFAKSRGFWAVGRLSLADWKSEQARGATAVQRDRLQVARLGLDVVLLAKARVEGGIGIARGIDLGSGTDAGDPLASRPGAGAKFTKFDAEVQVAAPIAPRLLLRLDTFAQYATRPLLASEEFGLGGTRIGRSFDFNQVTGDHGAGGMVELAYRLGDIKAGPARLELFGYADGGAAFRERPTATMPRSRWLAGTGAGARFSLLQMRWSGEVGFPVAGSGADRGVRAFVSVSRVF